MAFDLVTQYIIAFNTAYPQKRVDVKRRFNRQGKLMGFNVIIDGEDGSHRLLTTDELYEAIRSFRR